MKKAAIYARFSSANQRDESIDAQVRACRKYAADHELEIVHIYADRAQSGTTDQRDQFQAMIKAARRSGGFEVVLVHKLDRFSRDRLEAMMYKRDLEIHGVQLVSTLERLGDDPESALMESIYFGMAEFYSRNLAREVRKGMAENAARGLHCGGMAPFGFRLNKGTKLLEIEESEAEGVRMAFDALLAGCGYAEIADRLNAAGYQTRSGGRFTKGSLHGMLINEKYCGRWYYGKIAPKDARKKRNHHSFNESYTVIPGGCPAIVSEAVFDAAQRLLNGRRKGKRCDAVIDWLLSGTLKCGCCGGRMAPKSRTVRKTYRYNYYTCTNKDCQVTSIPKDVVEEQAISMLDECISDSTRAELAAQMAEQLSGGTDRKAIDKELEGIARKLENLQQALADGAPWAAVSATWDSLLARRNELEQKKLEAAGGTGYTLEDAQEFFSRFGALASMEPDKQAEIIRRNVREITVEPGDKKGDWIVRVVVFPPDAPHRGEDVGAYGGTGSGVPPYAPTNAPIVAFVGGALLLVRAFSG